MPPKERQGPGKISALDRMIAQNVDPELFGRLNGKWNGLTKKGLGHIVDIFPGETYFGVQKALARFCSENHLNNPAVDNLTLMVDTALVPGMTEEEAYEAIHGKLIRLSDEAEKKSDTPSTADNIDDPIKALAKSVLSLPEQPAAPPTDRLPPHYPRDFDEEAYFAKLQEEYRSGKVGRLSRTMLLPKVTLDQIDEITALKKRVRELELENEALKSKGAGEWWMAIDMPDSERKVLTLIFVERKTLDDAAFEMHMTSTQIFGLFRSALIRGNIANGASE